MNYLLYPIAITIVITFIAAGFDIKKGIIPNKLTLSLFVFGIATNTFFSIFFHDVSYVLCSIILSLLTFTLCYILWKIKLWAGGDVKLLTAIVASISISPNISSFQFLGFQFPFIANYPFPLTLIFNSILISFPFLLIFLVFNSYRNNLKDNKLSYRIFEYSNLRNMNKIISLKNLGFSKLKNFINKLKLKKKIIMRRIVLSLFFSFLLILITGIYENIYYSLYFLSLSIIFSLISSFIFKIIKKIRYFIKNASNKEIAIFNLNEGMIIDNMNILIEKKNIKNLNKLIDDFDFNQSNMNIKNLKPEKSSEEKSSEKKFKYILNSSSAAGLTFYDISFIKKLFNLKIIPRTIPIKIGIPFAPSIAIGLLISIFIGDLCLFLFNIFNNILNYLWVI